MNETEKATSWGTGNLKKEPLAEPRMWDFTLECEFEDMAHYRAFLERELQATADGSTIDTLTEALNALRKGGACQ